MLVTGSNCLLLSVVQGHVLEVSDASQYILRGVFLVALSLLECDVGLLRILQPAQGEGARMGNDGHDLGLAGGAPRRPGRYLKVTPCVSVLRDVFNAACGCWSDSWGPLLVCLHALVLQWVGGLSLEQHLGGTPSRKRPSDEGESGGGTMTRGSLPSLVKHLCRLCVDYG